MWLQWLKLVFQYKSLIANHLEAQVVLLSMRLISLPFYILMLQINLSYTSVTDVGLLSLASISCLQTMTILHLKGLTPRGLAAALLACGGLAKVKLHATFKVSLPQALFEHLETRGCVFHWRDKEFQVQILKEKCYQLKVSQAIIFQRSQFLMLFFLADFRLSWTQSLGNLSCKISCRRGSPLLYYGFKRSSEELTNRLNVHLH